MLRNSAFIVIIMATLTGCQTPDFSVPDIELPKLSLTRETPAPVEIGKGRIQRVAIPVDSAMGSPVARHPRR